MVVRLAGRGRGLTGEAWVGPQGQEAGGAAVVLVPEHPPALSPEIALLGDPPPARGGRGAAPAGRHGVHRLPRGEHQPGALLLTPSPLTHKPYGPVSIGDNVVSEDDCVVFRAIVEDNVTVCSGATVADECILREGSIVPESAVVTTQEEADAFPRR